MRAALAGPARHAVLLLTALGSSLALLTTSRYGVGLSPDSAGYISVARSLMAGNGFVDWTGEAFVVQPPLFPLLLALLGGITHADPLHVARFLNAGLFGATICLTGLWLHQHLRSRVLALAGCAGVALSVPLLRISTMAWSEALFVFLSVLFMDRLCRLLRSDDRGALLLCALCASLGLLTRYLGVTLVMTGAAVLLLARSETRGRKLGSVALFVSVSLAPLAVWCARNLLVSSTLMGERAPSLFTLRTNAALVVETVGAWFVYPRLVSAPTVVLLAGLALAVWIVTSLRSARSCSGRDIPGAASHPLFPFLCFSALYLGVLLFSATTVAFDALDYRLLSPLYVPLLCTLVYVVDSTAAREWPWRARRHVPALLNLAMIAWLAYPVAAAARLALTRMDQGVGYASARWAHSPLVCSLKQQPLQGYAASNDACLVYALTGSPAHPSPEKFHYNSQVSREGALSEFGRTVAAAPDAYLVWFEPAPFRHLHPLREIEAVARLSVVRQFPDGTIYRLTAPSLAVQAQARNQSVSREQPSAQGHPTRRG